MKFIVRLLVTAATVFTPHIITAQTWNNASVNNLWYDAANWSPNAGAASWTSSSIASFNQGGYYRTVGVDFSLDNTLSLDKITASGVFGSPNPVDSVVIGNTTAVNGVIDLSGNANGEIVNCSAHHLTIVNNTAGLGGTTSINISTANNTMRINTSTVEVNVPIAGNSGLRVKSGSLFGWLRLKAANTYTGTTLVENNGGGSSARLYLENAGGNTLNPASNLSVSFGSFVHVRTNQVLNNVYIASTGSIIVENGATLTITGTLTMHPGRTSGNIQFAPGAQLIYIGSGTTTTSEFPAVNGPSNVRVEFPAVINLHESRVITGTLSSQVDMPCLRLGNNDFTAAAAVCDNGGSFVVTNGTGKLYLSNVGAAAKIFPLKTLSGTANNITITNGQNITYGVRVVEGINPALSTSNNAVNRTWYVQPLTTPGTVANPLAPVNISFEYDNTHGNAGFNYTNPVDVLQYNNTTSTWQLGDGNITQVQPVTAAINGLIGGVETPFVIQNAGLITLAIHDIGLNAVMQNDGNGFINWVLKMDITQVKEVQLEKSANAREFYNEGVYAAGTGYYIDKKLLAGKNYYRLKVVYANGSFEYSAIAAIINTNSGFDIVGLLPSIVTTTTQLNISVAKKTALNVVVTDITGRPVQQQMYKAVAGSNLFTLNTTNLPAGIYYVAATTATGEVKTVRFVKQ